MNLVTFAITLFEESFEMKVASVFGLIVTMISSH